MTTAIVDNRIAGTRITVWDVYHYLEGGHWTPAQIAEILRLSVEQVECAMRYIEQNKEEVLKVHRQIEERNARGNPPEIEAMATESHARLLAWLEARRRYIPLA
jgi:uncharacterized protein (DUF433 family)